jgi:hypothetical protein
MSVERRRAIEAQAERSPRRITGRHGQKEPGPKKTTDEIGRLPPQCDTESRRTHRTARNDLGSTSSTRRVGSRRQGPDVAVGLDGFVRPSRAGGRPRETCGTTHSACRTCRTFPFGFLRWGSPWSPRAARMHYRCCLSVDRAAGPSTPSCKRVEPGTAPRVKAHPSRRLPARRVCAMALIKVDRNLVLLDVVERGTESALLESAAASAVAYGARVGRIRPAARRWTEVVSHLSSRHLSPLPRGGT